MSAAEEQQLVARILAGEELAFRELIKQYQRLVAHMVFKLVKDEQEREELCQDVFVKVHQNLASFKFQSKLGTWIGRIAYHHALNHIKKKQLPVVFFEELASRVGFGQDKPIEERMGAKAKAAMADRSQSPDVLLQATHLTAQLHEAIDALPPVYRTIVSLYHEEDLSYKEIGEMMELPEGTVKSYLFRARAKLKEHLLARYERDELMRE